MYLLDLCDGYRDFHCAAPFGESHLRNEFAVLRVMRKLNSPTNVKPLINLILIDYSKCIPEFFYELQYVCGKSFYII